LLGFILAGDSPVRAVTAWNDAAETNEDTSVTISVLTNDDGGGLKVDTVGAAGHGTVSIQAGGASVLYTPAADWYGTDSFTYSVMQSATPYYAGTGHYYEFVSVPGGITWSSAQSAAAGKKLYGLQGYLVTITSAGEQNFVNTKLNGSTAWMGASDVAVEGTWRWVTGPENGQSLSYTNWNSGEPNNMGDEDYGQFLAGSTGLWNDLSSTATVAGYVVEYGGMAGDPTPPAEILTATVTVTVDPVNDPPSFTGEGDETVLEDCGPQTITGWATSIYAGPANESSQSLTFAVSVDADPLLFKVNPWLNSSGTLSFTPNDDANGTATITVELHDNGGTTNGGVSASASQTFTITVSPVNDPPSFVKGSDQLSPEDWGPQSVFWAASVSAGPADEAGQALSFSVTNDHTTLFSVQPSISNIGVLTYTAAPNMNGHATVTVTLHDNGGTSNSGVDTSFSATFTITILPVNDPPTFVKGPDQTVIEDCGLRTIDEWATSISAGPGETAHTLTFLVSNVTSPWLFAEEPSISFNGDLSFTPASNASGTATITVVLQDDGGTSYGGKDCCDPQTFTITVTPVNDPPSFTKGADQTVLEDCGPQTIVPWATSVSAGAPDEFSQLLTFTVTGNTNPGLFAAGPAISSTGTLSFTPATNANGAATITVTLTDDATAGGAALTTAPQTFVITVAPVNDPPVISAGSTLTIIEDSGSVSRNVIVPSDPDSSVFTYSVVAAPSKGTATFTNPLIGTYTYKPLANANGSDSFTWKASDGSLDSNVVSQSIQISPVNDTPSFIKGADQTVLEDCGPQTVAAWATSISAGPANESGQLLTFTVTGNTNPGLFAAGPSLSSTGTLSFTPATNANGAATITVTLTDDATAGGAAVTTAPQTFVITVTPVNDPSSFIKGADQAVLEDCGPQMVASWATSISAGPGNEAGQILSFRASADNTALFSTQPAVNSTGSLTYTPAADANGSAVVTVILHDNGGTANGGSDSSVAQTFMITVTPVNDAPVNTTTPSTAGTMNVGDTLTADHGSWNDTIDTSVSGSSRLAFTYQWIRADDASGTHATDIPSATSSTYLLTDADAHKYLAVRVCCTDDGVGLPATQSASLTTSWTPQVINRVPSIAEGSSTLVTMDEDGSPTPFGLTLHAADADGDLLTWSIVSPALHGTATVSGTGTATTAAYTPATNWNGIDRFVVRVDDGYGGTGDVTVTTRIDPRNDPPENAMLPQVSGTAHAGCLLAATTGVWNDAIDLVPGTLTWAFQWQRSTDGGVCFVDIPGANAASYLLTTADNLQLVRCMVTCTDNGEGLPLLQSASAASVPVPVLNTAPIISEGAATSATCDEDEEPEPFNMTLHATDADGIDELTWHVAAGPSHGLLTFATDSSGITVTPTYHPAVNWNGTDGFALRVDDGLGGFAEICVTVNVHPRNDTPVCVVPPHISGEATVGGTITAFPGSWSDFLDRMPGHVMVTVQWVRASLGDGSDAQSIRGATGVTYEVRDVDAGSYLGIEVTAVDDGEGLPHSTQARCFSNFARALAGDTTPPGVQFVHSLPTMVDASRLAIEMAAEDTGSGVRSLTVNGIQVYPDASGLYRFDLSLDKGDNAVFIAAVDNAGNQWSQTSHIVFAPPVAHASVHAVTLAIGSKTMTVDGATRDLDAPAVIAEGRTLIPVRVLVESLGGSVQWNAATRQVTIKAQGTTIVLTIGKNVAMVNGKSQTIDPENGSVVPVLTSGRTMLPLRFVAESLGLQVGWDAETRVVTLSWDS
jgi:hypothetical protein